jgi:hypothetical protein
MRTRTFLGVILAVATSSGVVGCASQHPATKGVTVDTAAVSDVNFSAFHTYAWGGSAAIIRDPNKEWTAPDLNIGAEITYLIDRELRRRGMTEVTSDPDLLVYYGVGVDMDAMHVVEPAGEDAQRIERVPTGGLLVVLADPKNDEAVWAGGAQAELLEEPDADAVKARLDYANTTMLAKLPR